MNYRGKILWVDDEIDLLKPHIMYLENKGYNLEGNISLIPVFPSIS